MEFCDSDEPMLMHFQREYMLHGEFLLAPVTTRQDGQMYYAVEFGIVKKRIEFLSFGDIKGELELRGFRADLIDRLVSGQLGDSSN